MYILIHIYNARYTFLYLSTYYSTKNTHSKLLTTFLVSIVLILKVKFTI